MLKHIATPNIHRINVRTNGVRAREETTVWIPLPAEAVIPKEQVSNVPNVIVSVRIKKAKEEGIETVKPCSIDEFSFWRECIHKVTENRKAIAVKRGNVVPNRQHRIIKDSTEVERAEINVDAGLWVLKLPIIVIALVLNVVKVLILIKFINRMLKKNIKLCEYFGVISYMFTLKENY